MDDVRKYMETLGFTGDETLNMKECRKMFKRKSIAMLPEKHPTVPNAHSRFEEINLAFVEVIRLFKATVLKSITIIMKAVTNYVSVGNSCNACLVMVRNNKTAENTNTINI